MADRSKWKIKDYQRELAARGAKVSGRKKELAERLEAYERNDNFGFEPVIPREVDPLPHFPDISKFRTIIPADQGVFPKMAKSHVEQYVLYRQENQDEGGTKNVIKAVERGEKMVEDCILAASFFLEPAVPSASADDGSSPSLYISGIVNAEMRSTTTYSLKLVIDGQAGEIFQCHCECPAGMGPTGTCKHVVGVLLAIVNFVKQGVLQVQLSCTEQLQAFKKPKRPHQGPPVLAEDLGKGCRWLDDPRPKKYRNWDGYVDHLNNATINFCAVTGRDITMRYGMPKTEADLAAAELDHDYLKEPLVVT